MSEAANEILEQRVEAFRFVRQKGVADVFGDFHARTENVLLHILTDTATGALRLHDDQCRLIDFRQGDHQEHLAV
ncbi:MAG TPA: hypothetical protein VHF01_04525 [Candidatus Acidoferrum sp.]|nr:hypothetical protein [Candidatus Acidoferrum sp.]